MYKITKPKQGLGKVMKWVVISWKTDLFHSKYSVKDCEGTDSKIYALISITDLCNVMLLKWEMFDSTRGAQKYKFISQSHRSTAYYPYLFGSANDRVPKIILEQTPRYL
jgi:hypothetical protein